LFGCAKAQLEHQSGSFNRAVASTISQQALLNAIRASLDLPMSFTKLTSYTAGNMINGSFASKVPFGPEAASIFDLGPQVSWSSGVSQIQYSDANTASALAKLNERLSYDSVERYFREGFNPFLVHTLLVENIEIGAPLARALIQHKRISCRAPTNASVSASCQALRTIKGECPGPNTAVFGPLRLEKRHEFYIVENRGRTKCEFLGFVEVQITLFLSGYISDLVGETTYKKIETAEKKLVAVPFVSTAQKSSFQVPNVHAEFLREIHMLKVDKIKNRSPLKFTYRSPRSLLAYLGELIALQNDSKEMYVPSLPALDGGRMTMFRVVRGHQEFGDAGLAVRGPYGETYYVPRPDYGSISRDQTLRVLSIAGELVNAAISEKDIPAPASVVVQAIR
jgi:hypothetical protein